MLANVCTGMVAGEKIILFIVWLVFDGVMAGFFHKRINRCQSLLKT